MIISSEKKMLKLANNFGSDLVNNLNQNLIIYLKGELGSGKTTFSKGLIKGMGYKDLITKKDKKNSRKSKFHNFHKITSRHL